MQKLLRMQIKMVLLLLKTVMTTMPMSVLPSPGMKIWMEMVLVIQVALPQYARLLQKPGHSLETTVTMTTQTFIQTPLKSATQSTMTVTT